MRTDMTKLTVALLSFPNATSNGLANAGYTNLNVNLTFHCTLCAQIICSKEQPGLKFPVEVTNGKLPN
jgi:hypothetical protein